MKKKKPESESFELPGQLNPVFENAMNADLVLTKLGSALLANGSLVFQHVQITWTQSITRVYEVGTNYQYMIIGRASGHWQADRIVAPGPLSFQFYQNYAPPKESAPDLVCYEVADSGRSSSATVWTMSGVEISAVGFHAVTQTLAMQENVLGAFVGLTAAKK